MINHPIKTDSPEGRELVALLQKNFGVPVPFSALTVRLGRHDDPIQVSVEYAPTRPPSEGGK